MPSRRLLPRLFLDAVAKGAGATLNREGLDLGSTVAGAQRFEEEGFCSLGRQAGQRRRSCPSRLVSGIAYKGVEGGETQTSAVATRSRAGETNSGIPRCGVGNNGDNSSREQRLLDCPAEKVKGGLNLDAPGDGRRTGSKGADAGTYSLGRKGEGEDWS